MSAQREDTVACVICGKAVPYSRSRLFFVRNPATGEYGTIRTCQRGDSPHGRRK